jgi:hypothetical protein
VLTRRAVLVGGGLCLAAGSARAGDLEYRDWRVNTSAVREPLSDALIHAVEAQIDMVESLPLKPAVKAYFRKVDIKVDSSTLGHPGMYQWRTSHSLRGTTVHRITLGTGPIPANQPLLLYLLLLAHLDQNVERGWHNRRIKGWLDDAKRSGAFKTGAKMLHGPPEFFASSTGAVLLGRWPDEPYERAKVRARLPDFYAWVVGEFVPDGAVLP